MGEIHCPEDEGKLFSPPIMCFFVGGRAGGRAGAELGGGKEREFIFMAKIGFYGELSGEKIVDIGEGFWHIFICAPCNSKFKEIKFIFHL